MLKKRPVELEGDNSNQHQSLRMSPVIMDGRRNINYRNNKATDSTITLKSVEAIAQKQTTPQEVNTSSLPFASRIGTHPIKALKGTLSQFRMKTISSHSNGSPSEIAIEEINSTSRQVPPISMTARRNAFRTFFAEGAKLPPRGNSQSQVVHVSIASGREEQAGSLRKIRVKGDNTAVSKRNSLSVGSHVNTRDSFMNSFTRTLAPIKIKPAKGSDLEETYNKRVDEGP
jgi:hypothetical protein